MLVTRQNFEDVLNTLAPKNLLSIDTETTGLLVFKGDGIFSIIISDDENDYYFNFIPQENHPDDVWLLREHKQKLNVICSSVGRTWYLVNAKFDMHMLAKEGIHLAGPIWCCSAMGRLIRNDLWRYDMDSMAQRWLKVEKSDGPKEYMKKHKIFTRHKTADNKTITQYHYYKCPLEVMEPYGCKDGRITYDLGQWQYNAIEKIDAERNAAFPPLMQVAENEMQLTRTLFNMEQRGVKIDREYCKNALHAETQRNREARKKFESLCGFKFKESEKVLTEAFEKFQLPIAQTAKKNASFAKGAIKGLDHELINLILEIRSTDKKATTYYKNFLLMADKNDIIHADYKQHGAKTGRMSCQRPNLQNLAKEDVEENDLNDDDKKYIRRAFIPRSDDVIFLFIDYDQMEYRLMLDAAAKAGYVQKNVIDQVLSGQDVHTACAEMMDTKRAVAKTINFLKIYGGGIKKLAATLGVTVEQAKEYDRLYMDRLPELYNFIDRVRDVAAIRGFTRNWFGRRYTFPDPNRCYTTAPNWLIQGGSADVVKIAMNRCEDYLRGCRSQLLLQVHDELVFEMHKDDMDLVEPLRDILSTVYPQMYIPLTASIEWSYKSLADKIQGIPTAKEVSHGRRSQESQSSEAAG